MGAPRALALCLNFGGALDFQAGEWVQAERGLRDAVDLYRQVGSAAGEALSLQRLGVLLTAKGELDEAHAALTDALVVAERAAMRSHCLTRVWASLIRNRLAAEDRDGLEASLAEGLETARRHGQCVTCNALLLPEVIRAFVLLERLPEAEQSLTRLQETAAEFDSHAWTAMACQAAGRVSFARGDAGGAAAAFERARDEFLTVEQPYEAARCLRAMAACARAAGDPPRANELEGEAAALFECVGAPGIEGNV